MGWLSGMLAWFADPAHWRGPDGVPTRLVEHIGLSAAAVGLATLLAVPVALWLGHRGRGDSVAVTVSTVGRAVPTLAVLVVLSLAPSPFGLGTTSNLVALVLFAIPPLLTNTVVGVRDVDPGVVDAARGMGMSGRQVLLQVELPLAIPLLMNGLRLAAVQVVATATIAALVAGGGLGAIITQGYGRQDQAELLAGSLCVLLLALVVEVGLGALQRRVDPLRRGRAEMRGADA